MGNIHEIINEIKGMNPLQLSLLMQRIKDNDSADAELIRSIVREQPQYDPANDDKDIEVVEGAMDSEHPAIDDLPEGERKPFMEWLYGQTVPVRSDGRNAYFPDDYDRWKKDLDIID